MTPQEKADALNALRAEWEACHRCPLASPVGRIRHSVVFGYGNPDARLVIVGEGPGEAEDLNGEPYWPLAARGSILTSYLNSFGWTREDVFLLDVTACRATQEADPTRERAPRAAEVTACRPRVDAVIDIVDPLVVLMLGAVPLHALTKDRRTIGTVARVLEIPVIPVLTPGRQFPVHRNGIATFDLVHLARETADWSNLTKNSDAYFTYKAFEKAAHLIATYEHVYTGTPLLEIPNG